MKSLVISIDEEKYRQIKKLAKERDKTKGEIVREYIESGLKHEKLKEEWARAPIWKKARWFILGIPEKN